MEMLPSETISTARRIPSLGNAMVRSWMHAPPVADNVACDHFLATTLAAGTAEQLDAFHSTPQSSFPVLHPLPRCADISRCSKCVPSCVSEKLRPSEWSREILQPTAQVGLFHQAISNSTVNTTSLKPVMPSPPRYQYRHIHQSAGLYADEPTTTAEPLSASQWTTGQDVSPALLSVDPEYTTPSTPESEPPDLGVDETSCPLMDELTHLFPEDDSAYSCGLPLETSSSSHLSISYFPTPASGLNQTLPMPWSLDEFREAFIADISNYKRPIENMATADDKRVSASNSFVCENQSSTQKTMSEDTKDARTAFHEEESRQSSEAQADLSCAKKLRRESTSSKNTSSIEEKKDQKQKQEAIIQVPDSKELAKIFHTKVPTDVHKRESYRQAMAHDNRRHDLDFHPLPHPAAPPREKTSKNKTTFTAHPSTLQTFSSRDVPSQAWQLLSSRSNTLHTTLMESPLPLSPVSSPEADQQLILTSSVSEDDSESKTSISSAPPSPPPPEENPRHCRRSLRKRQKRKRLPSESPSLEQTKPKCKMSRQPPKKPARIKSSALEQKNRKGEIPRSLQLYEFLLHLLELRKARNCIKWEDASLGRFLITDSDCLAKRWGIYRSKPAMNYDKMSRAMRFYYKRRILDKTAGRLHYKFTESIMKQVERQRQLSNDSDVDESSESESESESETDSMSETNDESD